MSWGISKLKTASHILHIDAAGSYIGGDEDAGAMGFEAGHYLGTGRLAHIAMDAHSLVAGTGEILGEFVHHLLVLR